MDNLSAAIVPPRFRVTEKVAAERIQVIQRPALSPLAGIPRKRWSTSPDRVVDIPGTGGRHRRNAWTTCIGISGRLPPESVADMGRNTQ
jgi:hypothetical protein